LYKKIAGIPPHDSILRLAKWDGLLGETTAD
jgi:hypothetical protein